MRVVTETEFFVVLCPYAARFPFETWILPKRHESHFDDSDAPTLQNLAWVLRETLRKIDQALEHPPYNFIIHTAPLQEGAMPSYHWHIEIMPKLTKVAGFEWAHGIPYQSDASGGVGEVFAGSGRGVVILPAFAGMCPFPSSCIDCRTVEVSPPSVHTVEGISILVPSGSTSFQPYQKSLSKTTSLTSSSDA